MLIKIYAPSKSRERYDLLLQLAELIRNFESQDYIVIKGEGEVDFNCTFNPALHHNSAEPHPESAKP